jgi:hypothetical protein
MNDDDLWISDPAEIVEVDRFGSDPEFPAARRHATVELTFVPTQPFGEPHGKERWRETGRRIEEEGEFATRGLGVYLPPPLGSLYIGGRGGTLTPPPSKVGLKGGGALGNGQPLAC